MIVTMQEANYSQTMKQNLIPTVIVNKNGVTTTVYKKPPSAATSTRMSSPASPITASGHLTPEERNTLIEETCNFVRTVAGEPIISISKTYTDSIRIILNKSTDTAVQALHAYFGTQTKTKYQRRNREDLIPALSSHEKTITSATINEYFAVAPSINLRKISSAQVLGTLPALHQYPQLPDMDDYSEADDHTKAQVTALIKVTHALERLYLTKSTEETSLFDWSKGGHPTKSSSPREMGIPLETDPYDKITNPELIGIVTEYPDQAEEIISLILERGITNDTTLLKDILTSNSQALRSGLI